MVSAIHFSSGIRVAAEAARRSSWNCSEEGRVDELMEDLTEEAAFVIMRD